MTVQGEPPVESANAAERDHRADRNDLCGMGDPCSRERRGKSEPRSSMPEQPSNSAPMADSSSWSSRFGRPAHPNRNGSPISDLLAGVARTRRAATPSRLRLRRTHDHVRPGASHRHHRYPSHRQPQTLHLRHLPPEKRSRPVVSHVIDPCTARNVRPSVATRAHSAAQAGVVTT